MIALIPDPTTITHHGGINMFGTIMEYLVASAFAAIVFGGVVIGRKFLQLAHVRGDSEVLKARIMHENLHHDLTVTRHQHQLQQLALTAAPASVKEEGAEMVVVKDKEIIMPHEKMRDQWDHQRMKETAEDAEVAPV